MQPKMFKRNGYFHPNLFRSKAKKNLGNLFKGTADKNVEAGRTTKKSKRFFAVYDFLSLALLGISMAVVSLAMDVAIEALGNLHITWLRSLHNGSWAVTIASYTIWVSFSVLLTGGCSIFVHYISPQAIGSGIPEMKTVLRGVILKEYLSFRTMISKIVGLTLSLGSGMPIGKEGPFVHIASILANLLSKLLNTFDSVYINESRHSEMLAVGCAVGVACVFSAPVGGVLFSIEVTSVYFAVRNYWRGFFSAACSATTFRLLRVVLSQEITVTAFFQTHFPKEAFFPEELPIFALIGLLCGLGSAVFIFLHRKLVIFLRSNSAMKKIFQKHWYIYPILISFLISTLTYPKGVGQLLGGEKKFGQTAKDFFKNCTWSAPINSSEYCSEPEFLKNWVGTSGDLNIFVVLTCFILIYFFLVVLASTIPIPAGTFGPSFTLGAAFGRLVGELVYYMFPNGVRDGQTNVQVYPGVYSVVGAAAFCGGITHTVSVAVIIFELTGQLVALLPVMVAVLIANAVCSYFQPSIYDSIISLKHLPFLPDIPHASSNFHDIKVEQFMTTAVQYLTPQTTYGELQTILSNEANLKALPVVENSETLILLGSSSRKHLLESLERRVGDRARQAEALERMNTSLGVLEQRFRSTSKARSQTILAVDQLQPTPNNLEVQKTVPSKMKFYYTDLPEDQPDPKPSMDDMRKMSRFTVTSVVESQDPCQTRNQTRSRRNSVSSSDSEESKRRKRNGTFASNVVHGLTEAITHLSTGRYTNRHKFGNEIDLHGGERNQWENEQLAQIIDLTEIGVDSAPFQLTANTSLLKVHSLFSLLGLNRAYVTQHGKLIGVVALRDIGIAIELVHQGKLPVVNNEQEQEVKRKMRSMSVKEVEDIRNDKLNPQLIPLSRNPSLVSLHDADRSFVSLQDKRLSIPYFLNNGPDERIQCRPWQSVSSPIAETMRVHDFKSPRIDITPPKEETESIESLDSEDL